MLVSAFLELCGCQRLIGDAGWVLGLIRLEFSLLVLGSSCTAVRGVAAAGRGGNAFWKKARQKLLHSIAYADDWIIVGC